MRCSTGWYRALLVIGIALATQRSAATRLLERDDDFVGADQAEVAADQLVGHVGVGLARVEQRRAVAKLALLRLELGKLDLAAP